MTFSARWPGTCASCGKPTAQGDIVEFAARANGSRGVRHVHCAPTSHAYAPSAAPNVKQARSVQPPSGSAASPPAKSLLEAEAQMLLALEEYIVLVARQDVAAAKRADTTWQRYQKVKQLAYGRGATAAEQDTARKRALACALAVLDSLTGRNGSVL